MSRPLDPTPPIDAEGYDTGEGGPHYDPVRLTVDVTIDRDAFEPDEDAEDSAFKVLDDAVQVLNESAYDMAHSVTRVEPGQDYIVVRGGLVQNTPALPIFDMDVLDSDFIDDSTREEVRDLRERLLSMAGQYPVLAELAAECDRWLAADNPSS